MGEMDRISDGDLMRDYARSRSDASFERLVERFGGLVFGTAMRKMGSREMSEEVTQSVFAALARKAGKVKPDHLAGWLHRATTLEAAKMLRSELRHRRRKEALMNITHEPRGGDGPGDAVWQEVRPILDEAIDKLPEGDRRVVFLRYFQNLSLKDIAREIGKSEAATQKQSQRAVRKLSRLLSVRGVTFPAATLAAGLGAQLAIPLPPAVAATLAPAALATTASATTGATATQIITVMTQSKFIAVTSVIVLSCIPLVMQQAAIGKLEGKLSELEKGNRDLAANAESGPGRTLTSAVVANPSPLDRALEPGGAPIMAEDIDLEQLADDLYAARQGQFRKRAAAELLFDGFSPDEIADFLAQAGKLKIDIEKKKALLGFLIEDLADRDPKLALAVGVEAYPGTGSGNWHMVTHELNSAFAKWAKEDPEGALAWFDAMIVSGKLDSRGLSEHDSLRRRFESGLIAALYRKDESRGVAMLRRADEAIRESALKNMAGSFAGNAEKQDEFLALAREALPDADRRDSVMHSLSDCIRGEKGFEGLDEYIDRRKLSGDELEELIRHTATHRSWNPKGAESVLEDTIEWVQRRAPEEMAAGHVGAAIGSYAQDDFPMAVRRMNRFLDEGGGDRAIESFVASSGYMYSSQDTASGVFQLVARTGDDRLRQRLLNRSAEFFHRAGHAGIEKSLEASGLPAAEVAAALEAMKASGEETGVTVPAEIITVREGS